jgi:hypothetical protein
MNNEHRPKIIILDNRIKDMHSYFLKNFTEINNNHSSKVKDALLNKDKISQSNRIYNYFRNLFNFIKRD